MSLHFNRPYCSRVLGASKQKIALNIPDRKRSSLIDLHARLAFLADLHFRQVFLSQFAEGFVLSNIRGHWLKFLHRDLCILIRVCGIQVSNFEEIDILGSKAISLSSLPRSNFGRKLREVFLLLWQQMIVEQYQVIVCCFWLLSLSLAKFWKYPS